MLGRLLEWYKAFRLKQAGLIKLHNVPRALWQQITDDCLDKGWEQRHPCNALGARLSDDLYILRKGQSELKFNWHKDLAGIIIGPTRIIQGLQHQYSLPPL